VKVDYFLQWFVRSDFSEPIEGSLWVQVHLPRKLLHPKRPFYLNLLDNTLQIVDFIQAIAKNQQQNTAFRQPHFPHQQKKKKTKSAELEMEQSQPPPPPPQPTARYFVVKSKSTNSLQVALLNDIWAVTLRKNPPHPHQILNDAFEVSNASQPLVVLTLFSLKSGPVYLIFSANLTKKYFGFAQQLQTVPEPS
jgi:hypothetical protein